MKTSRQVFVKGLQVLTVFSGKYGIYAKINGINYSENKLIENGYELKVLSLEEIQEIENLKALEIRNAYDRKIEERFNTIELCLKSAPIVFTECIDLLNSSMIDAYSGSGKGTAYINGNKLLAFHYGYDQPSNVPQNCEVYRVQLSCHQITLITKFN